MLANEKSLKILVITPFDENDWLWHGLNFLGHQWTICNLALFSKKSFFWMVAALPWAFRSRKYNLVVSHHPQMSLCVAFWMRLLCIRTKHLAYSFNHGNGRFFEGFYGVIAKWSFKGLWGVVVFSEAEKDIYSKKYSIPKEKFSFTHWAVEMPKLDSEWLANTSVDNLYICSMGRNNRDWELLMKVAKNISYKFIVVCNAGALKNIAVPENVSVYDSLSPAQCASILKKSLLNVVVLKDDSRGTGHITIVNSMQLGIPLVVAKNSTVMDYFVSGKHGFTYTARSEEDLRLAIESALGDPDERRRQAIQCTEWADQWFSADAGKRSLAGILDNCLAGAPTPPSAPPLWG